MNNHTRQNLLLASSSFPRRWLKSTEGLWSAFLFLFLLILSVCSYISLPENATQIDINAMLLAPSTEHWLGTDQLGRDVLARLLDASYTSLKIAFLTTLIILVFASTIGFISGYFQGFVDQFCMLLSQILLSIPSLILLLAVAAFARPAPQYAVVWVIVMLSALSWMHCFRLVRADVIRIKQLPFVYAAKVMGFSIDRIAWKHIFPQLVPTLTAYSPVLLSIMLLSESGLSFLGLGISPPQATLGNMIADGRLTIRDAPWTAIAPGFILLLYALLFNLISEGVRRATETHKT